DNRARVNAVRASVRGVRERDEAGRLVYRFEYALKRNADAVVGSDDVDARAEPLLRLPDVRGRREVERGGDDLVAPARAEVEARGDDRQSDGRVRLHLHGATCSAEQTRDSVADSLGEFPPTRRPSVFARVPLPSVRVGEHRLARRARDGPEAVTQKVNPRSERRELFASAVEC